MLYIPAIGFAYGSFPEIAGEVICGYYNPNPSESIFLDQFKAIFVFEYIMVIVIVYNVVLISRYCTELKSKVPPERPFRRNSKAGWQWN